MANPPIVNFGNHRLSNENLPPNTTLQDISNFICRNWERMAYFAYDSFGQHGKGMTLFCWDDPEKNDYYYFSISDLYKYFDQNVIESAKKYEPSAYVFLGIAWYTDAEKTSGSTIFLNVFVMGKDKSIEIYRRNYGKKNSITTKS